MVDRHPFFSLEEGVSDELTSPEKCVKASFLCILNTYGSLSWRIDEMGNAHDPWYDNFKVAVAK